MVLVEEEKMNENKEILKDEIKTILNSFTLNGTKVFTSKNMYRAYRAKVTELIIIAIEKIIGKIE
jgi:hypothetical protein